MDLEDAQEEVIEAGQLIDIAYKKLMKSHKAFPRQSPYLKDVLISLGTCQLKIGGLIIDDFSEAGGSDGD